jgi:predicted nucleotidyltransferase
MHAEIVHALQGIERDQEVRVLYACESGSRAWGFASPDSDFDVRFLYTRKPDWYLSIDSGRDVIEADLPGDLDMAGWDLRKTLGLLRKSNPALLEWLRSPIVYAQDLRFVEELKAISADYYSLRRCFLHYLHMAQGNWRNYLLGDTVSYKKYLYVLRPVLAARWIEIKHEAAPMEFETLRAVLLEPDVDVAIEGLLAKKRVSSELERGPRIEALHKFLERELSRLDCVVWPMEDPPPTEPLNTFFRRWIHEA